MTDFDDMRAAVVTGDGVVARYPGVLVVAQGPEAAVHRLLTLCREVACSQQQPGRPLARRLAGWMGTGDATVDDLRFGTVAGTEQGLGVFLSGAVSLRLPGDAGTISGADAAAWLDRLIGPPAGPVALGLDPLAVPSGLLAGVHDLRVGVVPGAAVVAVPSGPDPVVTGARAAVPGTAAPGDAPPTAGPAREGGAPMVAEPVSPPAAEPVSPQPAEPAVPSAIPAPVEGPALRPPKRSDAILGATGGESLRPALGGGLAQQDVARPGPAAAAGPMDKQPAEPPVEPTEPAEPAEPKARGHLCSRGHLNDPRSHFCVLCGIRMNERTGVLVIGPRPPLGLMVFDDGATYTVDAGYLIGRMPEVDERVRSGALRSIMVDDRSGSVSRVHVEIRLKDWEVVLVDSGSRNGTFTAGPGEPTWVPVPPRGSLRLRPGTRVQFGRRSFVFESPSGVR